MRKKKAAGFTLVELIVVIAVMGILGGSSVPIYTGYIERANDAAVLSKLSEVSEAVQAIKHFNTGEIAYITVDSDGEMAIHEKTLGSNILGAEYYKDVEPLIDGAMAKSGYTFFVDGIAELMQKSGRFKMGAGWTREDGWVSLSDVRAGKVIVTNSELVNAFDHSSFGTAGTTRQLTQAVDSLVYTLGDMNSGSVLRTLYNDDQVQAFFKNKLHLTDDQMKGLSKYQKTAGLVLYIADQSKGLEVDDIVGKNAGEASALVNALNADKVADFALQYSTVLGYAYNNKDVRMNQYGACGNTKKENAYNLYDYLTSGNQIGGSNMTYGVFGEITGSEGYQEYKQSDLARSDVEGFLAAMQLINNNAENINIMDAKNYKFFANDVTGTFEEVIGRSGG